MKVQQFLFKLIGVLLFSLIHLLIVVFYVEPSVLSAFIGFGLGLINIAVLLYYFIQSIKLYHASKMVKHTKDRPIFKGFIVLGVAVNGLILYYLFVLIFTHITHLAQNLLN